MTLAALTHMHDAQTKQTTYVHDVTTSFWSLPMHICMLVVLKGVVKGYGRCCHENYRAHMCIPDVTKGTHVHDKSTDSRLACSPTHTWIQMDEHCVTNKVPYFCPQHLQTIATQHTRAWCTNQTDSCHEQTVRSDEYALVIANAPLCASVFNCLLDTKYSNPQTLWHPSYSPTNTCAQTCR